MNNSKRRREAEAAAKEAEMGAVTQVTVEFEELGLAIAQRQVADGGLTNPIETESFQIAGQVIHNFRTYVAGGAPRRVTVSAKAPRSWWHHVKLALAENARDKSLTWVGHRFATWLGPKVQWETIYAHEDVNRNICPHINRPNHHQKHIQFLAREV